MAYTTIDDPRDYHNTIHWTADDSSPRTFTGFTCQPDLLWGRHRNSGSLNYNFVDSVRGGSANNTPDTTAAEDNGSHGIISSFNSDGITVTNGNNATYPRLYYNELDPFGSGGGKYKYHYWNLNNGTSSSNTDGDITSTVQANTTSGMSVMTWTGTGVSGNTIGHGLGAVPKMTVIKQRNASNGWNVWHASNNNADPDSFGEMNSTASWYQDQGVNGPYTTAPTSSVLTLTAYGQVNGSSNTYFGYCFTDVKGFSKFGKFTGNGSSNGTFVYLGFKPALVIIKGLNVAQGWWIFDNKSEGYNPDNNLLQLENASAENTSNWIDLLSNGFKARSSDNGLNGAYNYVYAAWAESPFVSSTGVPTTAR